MENLKGMEWITEYLSQNIDMSDLKPFTIIRDCLTLNIPISPLTFYYLFISKIIVY